MKTETPPKGRISLTALSLHNRFFILVVSVFFCQPLLAQNPERVRETILQLRAGRECRERVEELTASNAALLKLCDELRARTDALHKGELELLRGQMQLEVDKLLISLEAEREKVRAWQTRSEEQDALIKTLTQRRKWWCAWLCKR